MWGNIFRFHTLPPEVIDWQIKIINQAFQFWQCRRPESIFISTEQALPDINRFGAFLRAPARCQTRIADQYSEFFCTDRNLRLDVHNSSTECRIKSKPEIDNSISN